MEESKETAFLETTNNSSSANSITKFPLHELTLVRANMFVLLLINIVIKLTESCYIIYDNCGNRGRLISQTTTTISSMNENENAATEDFAPKKNRVQWKKTECCRHSSRFPYPIIPIPI